MMFARVIAHNRLRHWGKLGIAVQAYQKRAPAIIQWLSDLSKTLHCQIPLRLVKGAYWDTEIKQAQQLGLEEYPVFTQKEHTDLSYLYCAQLLLSGRHFLFPQFATHNAHTVASVLTMAQQNKFQNYEFQRLHGMGETLYDHLFETVEGVRCRIYSPVGQFSELLPYLVRRLLENGANTSFVRQIQLNQSEGSWLIEEPSASISAMNQLRNPRIPLPRRIFYPERKNSRGLNLGAITTLQSLSRTMTKQLQQEQRKQEHPDPKDKPIFNPATPNEVVGTYRVANRHECLQAFDDSSSLTLLKKVLLAPAFSSSVRVNSMRLRGSASGKPRLRFFFEVVVLLDSGSCSSRSSKATSISTSSNRAIWNGSFSLLAANLRSIASRNCYSRSLIRRC
ncbi:hypothetical protein FT643_22475 [Ketobacter sp. MCCC 1A13808]|nr:hypothetical protein [Ketobacter sp. MCCC 1A13808]RLP52181.1 MAG: hypothetical protein D6160_22220 [Ketobacter sp.]